MQNPNIAANQSAEISRAKVSREKEIGGMPNISPGYIQNIQLLKEVEPFLGDSTSIQSGYSISPKELNTLLQGGLTKKIESFEDLLSHYLENTQAYISVMEQVAERMYSGGISDRTIAQMLLFIRLLEASSGDASPTSTQNADESREDSGDGDIGSTRQALTSDESESTPRHR